MWKKSPFNATIGATCFWRPDKTYSIGLGKAKFPLSTYVTISGQRTSCDTHQATKRQFSLSQQLPAPPVCLRSAHPTAAGSFLKIGARIATTALTTSMTAYATAPQLHCSLAGAVKRRRGTWSDAPSLLYKPALRGLLITSFGHQQKITSSTAPSPSARRKRLIQVTTANSLRFAILSKSWPFTFNYDIFVFVAT